MTRRFIFSFTLAALHALAQPNPQPPVYVQAFYHKWMPGMQEEGRKFLTQVGDKVNVSRIKSGGTNIGEMRSGW